MATQYSNSKIVTDKLAFSYDANDVMNSYKGEPTTNAIPTATINALPTYGNAWGTYNTNQYNGNVYFSIGTISSVTNNIVTTATSHPLRTYDVVTPQTTGGGVSAGGYYFIKKISDTQFSLHEYNSSQDGSQGYTNPSTGYPVVWNSIILDQRISINASSFPTMWWGPPHLPNSGIVKEIRPGGYTNPGTLQKTDCIRLRWIRPDGVTDGMAYGVDPYVEIGVPVTVSFYAKAVTPSAVGNYISFQNYNYGGPAGYSYTGMTVTWGAVGEWVRNSYTFTPTHNYLISYWFPSAGNMEVDIANIQIEQKSHATPFTTGTRSNTQGLLDLTGNSTITLTNMSYDSNAKFYFDGTDDYLSNINNSNITHGTDNFSYLAWIKLSGKPSLGTIFENGSWTSCLLIRYQTNGITIYSMGTYWGFFNFDPPLETWNHVAFIRNGNFIDFYVNGVYQSALGFTANIIPSSNIFIGTSQHSLSQCFNGKIDIAQIYTKNLTVAEIQQNYNAQKSKFGL